MEKREESAILIQKAFKFFIKKREVFAFAKKNKFNYSIYPSFLSEEDITKKIDLKIRLYKNLLKSDYFVLPVKFCHFRRCYVFDLPKNQFNSKSKKILNFAFISNNNKIIIDPKYKKVLLGDNYVNQINFGKFDKDEKLYKKYFKLKEDLDSDSSSDCKKNLEKPKKDEINHLNFNTINIHKLHSSKSSLLLLSNTFSNSTRDSTNPTSPTKKRRKKRKSILKNREGSANKIRENRRFKKRVSFGSSQISFYKSGINK